MSTSVITHARKDDHRHIAKQSSRSTTRRQVSAPPLAANAQPEAFIWSALSTAGNSYGVNAQGGHPVLGTPIILWPWAGGSNNELWTMDGAGHIISQMTGQLVIGLSADDPTTGPLVLCKLSDSDPTQLWTLANGMLANQSNGWVMSVSAGDPTTGPSLVIVEAPTGLPASNQVWQFASYFAAPPAAVPQWCSIQSALGTGGTSLVLDLKGGSATTGTPVVLAAQNPGSSTQKWLITPDGRMLNNSGVQLVLGLGQPMSGGSYLDVQTQYMPPIDDEIWTAQPGGLFQNAGVGLYLTVQGNAPTAGSALIVADQTQGLQGQVFATLPPNALGAVLAAGPQPFLDFQDDPNQLAAYTHINQQLVRSGDFTGDLRATYINTDFTASYSDWVSQILAMRRPDRIPQPDWTFVSNQLQAELQAVTAVQTLFANYGIFHAQVFAGQDALVGSLVADAGLTSDGPNISGVVLSVISGVLYAVLEAIPGGGAAVNAFSVLGNIVQAGINIGVAAQGTGAVSADPFDVEVGELWSTLSANFDALLTSTGTMETAILSDGGKLFATFALINSTGPDSLAWPPDLTPQLVDASTPGFTVAIMQMLMPTKYQIYSWQQDNADEFSGVSPLVQRIESNGDGTYNHYWIASGDDWSDYPIDAAMNDCFAAGDNGWDFFHSAGGWTFPQAYYVDEDYVYGNVTISNQTYNPLNIVVTMNDGTTPKDNLTALSYMSCCVPAQANDYINMQIDIYDPVISTSEPVASFTAQAGTAGLPHPALGQDVTPSPTTRRARGGSGAPNARKGARVDKVDSQSQGGGYSLSAFVSNEGQNPYVMNGYEGYSADLQVTVFYNPASS